MGTSCVRTCGLWAREWGRYLDLWLEHYMFLRLCGVVVCFVVLSVCSTPLSVGRTYIQKEPVARYVCKKGTRHRVMEKGTSGLEPRRGVAR